MFIVTLSDRGEENMETSTLIVINIISLIMSMFCNFLCAYSTNCPPVAISTVSLMISAVLLGRIC